MSDQGVTEYATGSGNDYSEHEHTYQMFLKVLQRAIAVIVGVLVLMAIFLA